jgi:hypothetical protein
MSPTDYRERGLHGCNVGRFALNGPSGAVEHVKSRCPALIATLVAMARASKDGQDVDDSAAAAASQGSPGCARYPLAVADRPPAARWQELLGNPPPNRRRRARPTGGPADAAL